MLYTCNALKEEQWCGSGDFHYTKRKSNLQMVPFAKREVGRNATGDNSIDQKLVLFAGPHKTGSTAVEEFFTKWFSPGGKPNLTLSFDTYNWIWPTSRTKGFFPLLSPDESPKKQDVLDNIHEAWAISKHNVVVGLEGFCSSQRHRSFDFDESLPVPHGYQAMRQVVAKLGNGTQPEAIVLIYRTPRSAQWISNWKQQVRLSNQTYDEWICSLNKTGVNVALMDALGLAYRIRRRDNWPVVMVDSAGVASAGKDISHTIACEVLKLPCTQDGWVRGIPPVPIKANVRHGSPGLTPAQIDDIEWLFLQRDCHFQNLLSNDPLFRILENKTIWRWEDCELYNSFPAHATWKKQIQDDWIISDLLLSQADCINTRSIIDPLIVANLSEFRSRIEASVGWVRQVKMKEEFGAAPLAVPHNALRGIFLTTFLFLVVSMFCRRLLKSNQWVAKQAK